MRSVMKRTCLSLAVIAVLIFTGCGQKKTKDPITVTLWHVYGGQTESPLNDLIDQFNETIGKEENIGYRLAVLRTRIQYMKMYWHLHLEIRELPNCRICLFPIRKLFWLCRMTPFL